MSSLRLGTFNVWGLPETFGFGDDVSSRMREIARRLEASDLDVLMIQEAWTEEVRTTLAEGARRAGFFVADPPGANGGLMTLSRRPIVEAHFERFGFRGDPERIASGEFLGGKGFQSVVIDGEPGDEARRITLLNTHLHARYRRSRPRLNSAVRVAQLLQVLRHLSQTEGTVVIGGDFNCSDEDLEYAVFAGLSGASELGGGSEHPTLSKTNYYKRHRTAEDKRIDFLFVRPGSDITWRPSEARLLFAETARIRDIDRSLSDHFGFRATLSMMPVVQPVAASSASPPDPRALALAEELLALGDAEASRRRTFHLSSAGTLATVAAAAVAVRRAPEVDRRRFLRGVVTSAAWLSVVPAAGLGALGYFDGEGKRGAFDDARAVLAELSRRDPRATV